MSENRCKHDVGHWFIYGPVLAGIVLMTLYFVVLHPAIKDCEKDGGVRVKSNGNSICIDKSAIKKPGAKESVP